MTDTGGPAFPKIIHGELKRGDASGFGTTHYQTMFFENSGGMTLLDWFAGQAMKAILSTEASVLALARGKLANPAKFVAETAYDQAEAMIAEKRKRENEQG